MSFGRTICQPGACGETSSMATSLTTIVRVALAADDLLQPARGIGRLAQPSVEQFYKGRAHHADRPDRAGRHQRHRRPAGGAASRSIHPRPSEHRRAEYPRRRRARRRRTSSTTPPSATAASSRSWSAERRRPRSRAIRTRMFDPLKFTWLGSLSSYANDAYLAAHQCIAPGPRASPICAREACR